jgi:peptidoglycan/xylan/chitin deacetylase (PgdA/CDA1 family)
VSAQVKRRLRNALVRAGAATQRGPSAGKRALALHDVPDVKRFGEVLDRLRAEYEILSLEEWLTAPPARRTQLTLTFDDGYASWHEAVAPLLEDRRLPAVFFVSSGLVGLEGEEARAFVRNRLRRRRELRLIGMAQLQDLARHPLFEVGAHTLTHADLGRVTDRDVARTEIAADRARLEDWLGSPVRWFAYPFGGPRNVSRTARAVVEDVGMSAAFTLIPGWWEPTAGDRFRIGRDGLDPSLPYAVWQAWLRGGYDRIFGVKSAIAARAGARWRGAGLP